MKTDQLIPPSDLLERAGGVETGLKRRNRIGRSAQVGLLLLVAVQILLNLDDKGLIAALSKFRRTASEQGPGTAIGDLLRHWEYVVVFALILIFLLIYMWSRFWLRSSRHPFRYTCSIGAFTGVHDWKAVPDAAAAAEPMRWLSNDVAQLLSERVQRFQFASTVDGPDGEKPLGGTDSESSNSSIHVHGRFVVRPSSKPEGKLEIQITPLVRIGPPGEPETLGHPTPPHQLKGGTKSPLSRRDYDTLLEFVYHSVVTEIYRQLKDDVQRKIALLPTRYLRMVALLNEADDYAHSNALHAYEQARDLYAEAAEVIDPGRRLLPQGRFLRWGRRVNLRIARAGTALRRLLSTVRPAIGRREVLAARADIGYARMLLFRRNLATMMGQRPNPVFEASLSLERAAARLGRVGGDVPGHRQALFDLHVTRALASDLTAGGTELSREDLERAAGLAPKLAVTDPVYLFVLAEIGDAGQAKVGLLRRAVDVAPRFELAVFELALASEHLWRAQPELDRNGADLVLAEYEALRRINPANIGAWANPGYIRWLLGEDQDLRAAEKLFLNGTQAKAIRPETSIAELDYGLARLYAEQGDFVRSYSRIHAATSEMFSEGALQLNTSFRGYYFDPPSEAVVRRFEQYERCVAPVERGPSNGEPHSLAIRRTVEAFVLNDVGEAMYGMRPESVTVGWFQRAIKRDAHYALARFNRAGLLKTADRVEELDDVVQLVPEWPDGVLALAHACCDQANALQAEALDCDESASKRELEAARLDKEAEQASEAAAQLAAEQQGGRAAAAVQHRPGLSDVGPWWFSGVSPTQAPPTSWELRQSHQLDTARAKEKEAQKERDEAEREREKAESLRESHETFFRRAADQAARLLPHAWLWNDPAGKREEANFNWSALTDPVVIAEGRWEREMQDLHVEALYTWSQHLWNRAELLGGATGGRPLGDGWDERKERGALLLSHIRDRFWPQHEGVLYALHRLSPNEATTEALHRAVRDRLRRVPDNPAETDLERYGFSVEQSRALLRTQRRMLREARKRNSDIRIREMLVSIYLAEVELWKDSSGEAIRILEEATEEVPDPTVLSRLGDVLAKPHTADVGALARAIEMKRQAIEMKRQARQLDATYRSLEDDIASLECRLRVRSRVDALDQRFGADAAARARAPRPLVRVTLSPHFRSVTKSALNEWLELLRTGMYYQSGVYFPTPQFLVEQQDGDGGGRYAISLDSIPLAEHSLDLGGRFLPVAPETLRAHGVATRPMVNPANGNEGSWIAEDDLDAATRAAGDDVRPYDALGVIVLHLASIYRAHAPEFLDIDAVYARLREQSSPDEIDKLRSNGAMEAFTAVLRALVAEGFPLLELGSIASIFLTRHAHREARVQIVEGIRRELSHGNPWLAQDYTYFELGPDLVSAFEEGLAKGEHQVLALEPSLCQDMLAAVRNWVAVTVERNLRPVLFCPPTIRPWAKRLCELEFPHLQVVATDDVIPELAKQIGGTIHLYDPDDWVEPADVRE